MVDVTKRRRVASAVLAVSVVLGGVSIVLTWQLGVVLTLVLFVGAVNELNEAREKMRRLGRGRPLAPPTASTDAVSKRYVDGGGR